MTRRPQPPLRLTELGEFVKELGIGVLALLVLPATYAIAVWAVVR